MRTCLPLSQCRKLQDPTLISKACTKEHASECHANILLMMVILLFRLFPTKSPRKVFLLNPVQALLLARGRVQLRPLPLTPLPVPNPVPSSPMCYDRTACTIRLGLQWLVTRLYLDELILGAM